MAPASTATPTLVLSRSDVLELLPLRDCIDAVERAFRLHAEGRTFGPGVLGIHAASGSFHIAVYEKARALGRGTEVKLDA